MWAPDTAALTVRMCYARGPGRRRLLATDSWWTLSLVDAGLSPRRVWPVCGARSVAWALFVGSDYSRPPLWDWITSFLACGSSGRAVPRGLGAGLPPKALQLVWLVKATSMFLSEITTASPCWTCPSSHIRRGRLGHLTLRSRVSLQLLGRLLYLRHLVRAGSFRLHGAHLPRWVSAGICPLVGRGLLSVRLCWGVSSFDVGGVFYIFLNSGSGYRPGYSLGCVEGRAEASVRAVSSGLTQFCLVFVGWSWQ